MKPGVNSRSRIISAEWQKERAWNVKICVSPRPAFNFLFVPRWIPLRLLPSLNNFAEWRTRELYVTAV
jgi:hypothetical protein